jgi:alkylation response protein AidB-like acyl-CoA dehydrogenase
MNAINFDSLGETLKSLSAAFEATAAEHDRDGSFPFENFARLHKHGLLALTIPAAQGGGGANLATTARVVRAVARGEPSTALVLVMQYLSHRTILRGWPAALREEITQDAVRNGGLINALRVEPELGTPARGGLPATIARRVEGGWRLSGTKIYSTGIPILRWLNVWVRTDEAEPRVGFLVVPRGTDGVTVNETWNHLGMRATGSHEVVFDDVFVADHYAADLRAPAQWADRGGEQLSWMIVLQTVIYDAVAEAARDWLVRYLRERTPTNLGAPLSSLPRFQEAVGEMEARLLTNRTLLESATEAADRGTPWPAERLLLVKHIATANVIAVTGRALELTGNPGLSRNNPLERHHRNALCSRIHTPQDDVILATAGRAAFAAQAAREMVA